MLEGNVYGFRRAVWRLALRVGEDRAPQRRGRINFMDLPVWGARLPAAARYEEEEPCRALVRLSLSLEEEPE